MSARSHDRSLSLMAHGYDFGERIWRRTREGARAVPTRLLGRDALLVRGVEGVELFYDEDRIARHGAQSDDHTLAFRRAADALR